VVVPPTSSCHAAIVGVLVLGACTNDFATLYAGTASGSGAGGAHASSTTGAAGQASYGDIVLGDGPLGYWHFDEDVGPSAHDATGHGYDGTYVGSIVFAVPAGFAGSKGFGLAGMGYVDLGDDPIFAFPHVAPYTFEVWVKIATSDATFRKVVSREDGLPQSGYALQVNGTYPDDDLHFDRVAGGTYLSGASAKHVTLDAFHYVVATFDGATSYLYVDGVRAMYATGPPGDLPAPSRSLHVGRHSATTYGPFIGVIAELAIYDRVLKESEIQAHYEAALAAR
jgi:Concanavalin A-like lectin/glucanases superfamily